MTLQEIDERLAMWKNVLAAMDQHLMALLGHAAYQSLAGLNGVPKVDLTGTSSSTVASALQRVELFLEYSRLLQEVIDHASEIRRRIISFINNEKRLQEIDHLLLGKSIRLPALQMPPEQRSVMRGLEKETAVSPAELLKVMHRTFEAARDVVLAVDTAWKKLRKGIDDGAAQINSLESSCEKLKRKPPDDLAVAKDWLDDLRTTVRTDPLGTLASFNSEITPLLARLQAEIEEDSGREQELEDLFSNSRAALQKFCDLHRESELVFAERQEKVTECDSLPAPYPDEKVDALRVWLRRLETKRTEGIVQPLVIGMRNWNAAVQECTRTEQATYEANRGAIETRNELRGRLDALKAKARAYGVDEEAGLLQLAVDADSVLYARPTPLNRANALVTRYKERLDAHTMQAKT